MDGTTRPLAGGCLRDKRATGEAATRANSLARRTARAQRSQAVGAVTTFDVDRAELAVIQAEQQVADGTVLVKGIALNNPERTALAVSTAL